MYGYAQCREWSLKQNTQGPGEAHPKMPSLAPMQQSQTEQLAFSPADAKQAYLTAIHNTGAQEPAGGPAQGGTAGRQGCDPKACLRSAQASSSPQVVFVQECVGGYHAHGWGDGRRGGSQVHSSLLPGTESRSRCWIERGACVMWLPAHPTILSLVPHSILPHQCHGRYSTASNSPPRHSCPPACHTSMHNGQVHSGPNWWLSPGGKPSIYLTPPPLAATMCACSPSSCTPKPY